MHDKESLKKPAISKTYGDPNDQNVLNWYIQGNRSPHISVESYRNKTVKKSRVEIPSTGREGVSGLASSGQHRKSYSKFASRPLRKASIDSDDGITFAGIISSLLRPCLRRLGARRQGTRQAPHRVTQWGSLPGRPA